MRAAALSRVLRNAHAAGLRPFEIFAEGKAWIDQERMKARGLVDAIQARTLEIASGREGEANRSIEGRRRGPKPKVEDAGEGVGRDLGYARGTHSHLMELRRAAISAIRKGEGTHVQG